MSQVGFLGKQTETERNMSDVCKGKSWAQHLREGGGGSRSGQREKLRCCPSPLTASGHLTEALELKQPSEMSLLHHHGQALPPAPWPFTACGQPGEEFTASAAGAVPEGTDRRATWTTCPVPVAPRPQQRDLRGASQCPPWEVYVTVTMKHLRLYCEPSETYQIKTVT